VVDFISFMHKLVLWPMEYTHVEEYITRIDMDKLKTETSNMDLKLGYDYSGVFELSYQS